MILFDAYTWIDYVKGLPSSIADLLLDPLFKRKVVIGPLIVQKVLQGVVDSQRLRFLKTVLLILPKIKASTYDLSMQAAHIYFQFQIKGIPIRKPNDTFIFAHGVL